MHRRVRRPAKRFRIEHNLIADPAEQVDRSSRLPENPWIYSPYCHGAIATPPSS
jgi:hypothetical protein